MLRKRGIHFLYLFGAVMVPGFISLLPFQNIIAADTAKEPIEIKADSMGFDQNSGEATLQGNVVITYGKIKLLADKATVNRETKQARAEGHVRLRQGYKEWVSDSLDYNFATGAMKAGLARAELDHGLFFEGKTLESTDRNKYILKDSYLTTSDYDKPEYHVKAGSITLYPHNRIALHNLVLFIGPVPVFYFPYVVIPLDDHETDHNGVSTGTQVQVGSKSRWGFFVLNSYTTQITEDLRPTLHLDYRTQRGLAGGADLRYKAGDQYNPNKEGEFQPRVSGKIKTYYADDSKIRKSGSQDVVTSTGITNQKIAPERYQVRVTQRADLREDLYSKLKINKISDPNFLEDFFEKEFQKDPQPDNFFEFTKWSPNSTLSLLTRARLNNFNTTTERLPELRYNLNRRPIFGGPIFYEGDNSVAYLSKEFARFTPLNNYHTTRLDTFHQFLYPKQYFGWLNVTPRVGGRATFYNQSGQQTNGSSLIRGVFNTGFEAGYKATRTWKDVSNKKWEIDGLRHVIEPGINYGFVLKPNYGPNRLPQFDVQHSSFGIDKNLVPIDFPQFTGTDSIDKRNVFRPALRQRLQTKRDGQTWDLAELLLYQDILADKVAGEKTLSDLFAEFATKPTRWLELGWNGRYDYDGNQIRESNTTASVFKGKSWKVTVGHNYFRPVGNQMGFGFQWTLNEDWALRTSHRFDPAKGSLFEQAYAIDRDLHTWIATLSISELRPLNRKPDLRVWLSFTLKEFPEATVDSNQLIR